MITAKFNLKRDGVLVGEVTKEFEDVNAMVKWLNAQNENPLLPNLHHDLVVCSTI